MPNITLGPCHYDQDEIAVAVAVREDGSGWIPVCDEHKSKAEQDGYTIGDDVPPEDRADSHITQPADPADTADDGDAAADGDDEE